MVPWFVCAALLCFHPSIHLLHLVTFRITVGLRPVPAVIEQRSGKSRTGHQSVAGQAQRDRQPLTLMSILETPVNPTCIGLWEEAGVPGPTQTWGEHTNSTLRSQPATGF